MVYYLFCVIFFFKQKTAYEMRISDWSSDVCSSDLIDHPANAVDQADVEEAELAAALDRVVLVGQRATGAGAADERARAQHVGILVRLEDHGIGGAAPHQPAAAAQRHRPVDHIGRASVRERVCQYI